MIRRLTQHIWIWVLILLLLAVLYILLEGGPSVLPAIYHHP